MSQFKTNSSKLVLEASYRGAAVQVREGVAGGAINAFDIVTVDNSTTPPTVAASTATGAEGPLYMAHPNLLQDPQVADDADSAFVADDVVPFTLALRGMIVNGRVATGVTAAKDDLLGTGGAVTAGCYTAGSSFADRKVKLLDTVTGGAAPVLARMEVL